MMAGRRTYPQLPFCRNQAVFRSIISPAVWKFIDTIWQPHFHRSWGFMLLESMRMGLGYTRDRKCLLWFTKSPGLSLARRKARVSWKEHSSQDFCFSDDVWKSVKRIEQQRVTRSESSFKSWKRLGESWRGFDWVTPVKETLFCTVSFSFPPGAVPPLFAAFNRWHISAPSSSSLTSPSSASEPDPSFLPLSRIRCLRASGEGRYDSPSSGGSVCILSPSILTRCCHITFCCWCEQWFSIHTINGYSDATNAYFPIASNTQRQASGGERLCPVHTTGSSSGPSHTSTSTHRQPILRARM